MYAHCIGICGGQQRQNIRPRVIFKEEGLKLIMLHKPHPGSIIKSYVMKQVYDYLKNERLI